MIAVMLSVCVFVVVVVVVFFLAVNMHLSACWECCLFFFSFQECLGIILLNHLPLPRKVK